MIITFFNTHKPFGTVTTYNIEYNYYNYTYYKIIKYNMYSVYI